MKMLILVALQLSVSVALFAQDDDELIDERPLNSISLNLLGDASLISINYKRQFIINPSFILTSKLGAGFNKEFQLNLCFSGSCTNSPSPEIFFTIPHHITGNIGKERHFFEFGLGGTNIVGNTSQPYLFYPIIGYRLSPEEADNINFRIFLQVPFSGLDTDKILFSPLGLNFGISF
ncbi:hypothetical protein [Chondrinema litorale]|uniref:hypothetical protein n=1 Tax=Chondrinema litorale TaxID=2994555 RepID=UPI002543CF87|nr:hypothetical protein [Chondrinema litorale]UZR94095.1 hypothetical protein OQ292_19825 [Chondrinema litorale]